MSPRRPIESGANRRLLWVILMHPFTDCLKNQPCVQRKWIVFLTITLEETLRNIKNIPTRNDKHSSSCAGSTYVLKLLFATPFEMLGSTKTFASPKESIRNAALLCNNWIIQKEMICAPHDELNHWKERPLESLTTEQKMRKFSFLLTGQAYLTQLWRRGWGSYGSQNAQTIGISII